MDKASLSKDGWQGTVPTTVANTNIPILILHPYRCSPGMTSQIGIAILIMGQSVSVLLEIQLLSWGLAGLAGKFRHTCDDA